MNLHMRKKYEGFPFQYIKSVKSPDKYVLQSNCEMCEAFQEHFHDHFACCPDLLVQEFYSYLADFSHLWEAEAASCESVVTECEVHAVLKQVGLNKSPRLDGLPYKMYLKLLHMFVPILMDMFNHRFTQGVIPGNVTKGVICEGNGRNIPGHAKHAQTCLACRAERQNRDGCLKHIWRWEISNQREVICMYANSCEISWT